MAAPQGMTAERWALLKSLFDEALALDRAKQAEFLQQLGKRDPTLELSLRSLVRHYDSAPALLEGPLISQQRIIEYLSAGVRTFQPGELVAGRFRIQRFIGEGGMGEVYAARDLDLGEDVALKTLRPCLSSNVELLDRFKLEIQTARRVTHPNVCRVFDLFWHRLEGSSGQGIAFLTMELIDGETLEQRIRTQGRFTEDQALPIVKQLVAGLNAAHQAGIVHRDFKSGNILLVEEGGAVRALITDFGLARSIEDEPAWYKGAIEGTLAYLAPEQLHGSTVSRAADIYALGVVVFEMVTGRLPFETADSLEMAERQRESPPLPRSEVPKLEKRWEATILACLAYDPARRPSSAEQVLSLLMLGRISRRAVAITAAASLGAAVSARLWLREKPISAEALRSFKRGEDFAQRRNAEGLKNAVVEFKRAVELEPGYSPAWIGLADAYSALGNFDLIDPREAMARSKAAAARAVALGGRSGKAQGVYGRILSLDVHEWLRAEPYFRKAVSLDASDPMIRLWYGAYLGKMARARDAFEQLRAGLEQAPSSMPLNQQLATELFWEGRFSEFLTEARELVRLQPFEAGSHLVLARALEWEKRYDEALRSCDEADRLRSTQTSLCYRSSIEIARGNAAAGRKIADALRRYWDKQPFESALLAALYAQLDDAHAALDILNEGYKREDSTVLTAGCNPYFDGIRKTPAFQDFLKKIGWPKRPK